MANISDVAKLAGLSVSTVSRVINNHKYVSDDKREVIMKAMKELDYQPSAAAKQMRGQSSRIIGVIVPRITNPFFSYLVDEIQQEAFRNDFQIMIFQSNEDAGKEASFLELLAKKQVDAIIMCALENDQEFIKSFTKYGPIVLCNETFEECDLPAVHLDQKAGAYMGTKYLLEKGRRKIAYCTGCLYDDHGKDKGRNAGFHQAISEYGVRSNMDWIFVDQHTIDHGKSVAQQIYDMGENRPDGIFTGSDEIAAGFIVEAARLGLKVPEDISVLGFDDQPLAQLTTPGITTVRQPIQELGRETFHVLLSLLQGKSYVSSNEKLKMELIVRGSV